MGSCLSFGEDGFSPIRDYAGGNKDAEQREAARQFANKWKGRGREDEDGRSYWIDFLSNVLGKTNVDRVLKMEVEQDAEKEKDHGQR